MQIKTVKIDGENYFNTRNAARYLGIPQQELAMILLVDGVPRRLFRKVLYIHEDNVEILANELAGDKNK